MIRLATINDLDSIMEIIQDAKHLLKNSGSSQWNTTNGYPSRETFKDDILHQRLYVYEKHSIFGIMCCIVGLDPNYQSIEGHWLSDSIHYLTIHRIATRKEVYRTGIAKELFQFAKQLAKQYKCTSIRIDTHSLNIPMQHLIIQQGFQYCGKIHLLNQEDSLRLAYEFLI